MKLIDQKYAMSCGQACLAMVAGISLAKACKIIGNNRGTITKQLVKALKKLGFKCKNRLKIGEPEYLAIVKEKSYDDTNWHWVVYYNGNYYDPAKGINPKLSRNTKYTSCLEIKK
jgi:ABC-type bacteriocin/lantibiotic exporter with double-glycine peptidase domain